MGSMRKGSLEYWPHRRARKQMPRVRTWVHSSKPEFLGFVAFKAGMSHITMINDDDYSPSKGTEISRPVTILEIPKVNVYGMRFYSKPFYKEPGPAYYDKNMAKTLGISKLKNNNLEALKNNQKFIDVTALLYLDASTLGFGNKKIMRFEVGIGGNTLSEKATFIEKWIGKQIDVGDVLSEGEYVDVTSISKGKGWTGVIKRFGVARQMRKSTQKIRHVGTLGPWHPAKVTYMVPMAGQMGYNYRTEINKRVLQIGKKENAKEVNVAGGFMDYGVVKNDFIVVEGSIPGVSKRLVRIRKALRKYGLPLKKPDIKYISLNSKQGA
jgi:large subunit ribosomal protein L3